MIFIEKGKEDHYHVEVVDPNGSKSQHVVTVELPYLAKLGWENTAVIEDLLRKSFEFLIAREPKESLLPSFKLQEIACYYPEFEEEIRKC